MIGFLIDKWNNVCAILYILENKFYFSVRESFMLCNQTNKLETKNIVCFSISKTTVHVDPRPE